MKKLLSLFILSALCLSVIAQEEGPEYKPGKGDKGFTGVINGLAVLQLSKGDFAAGGILFRYYTSDKMAVRLALGVDAGGTTVKDEVSNPGVRNTTKNPYTAFGITPGVQWSMGNLKRLEPYIGVDMPIQIFNRKNVVRSEVIDDTQTFGTNGDFTETTTKFGNDFRIGLAGVLGFNYYLSKNFALGAEYGWGPKIGMTSGNTVTTITKTGSTETETVAEGPGNTTFTLIGTNVGYVTFSVFW